MPYLELYSRTGGSNLNSGSTTATTPTYEATNGGWNSATGVFTPASGDPSASVAVGNLASVYIDGATVGVFIARVDAVSSTTVTVSLTAKSGTAPTTNATLRTMRVGGALKGPNGTEAFPLGFLTNALVNASSNPPRLNMMNVDGAYNITAGITHGGAGPVCIQGCTSAANDGGRATIDGGTTNATLLTISATNHIFRDLIVQNNATGTGIDAFQISGAENIFIRCVANNVRRIGFYTLTGGHCTFIECEAYACNTANSASIGAFYISGNANTYIRCIAHDNSGSNNIGFVMAGEQGEFHECIADTNGLYGFWLVPTTKHVLKNCDAYNNVGDGIRMTGLGSCVIENCNLIKNGTGGTGYGINWVTAAGNGYVRNCGFGAGTQANTTGATAFLAGCAVTEENSVTYANDVTPWVDPANGDFRINRAAAINTGRGSFTQTASSYAGAVGYPDIGAVGALGGAGIPIGLGSPVIRAM